MRVTQNMLANTNLRYISQGYEKLGKIQEQLVSGKKINRPSDDPVVAMKGMRYRSEVAEVEQFQRNLSEVYNWMENSDTTLDKVTLSMQRIRELTVQASNDTYEKTQRESIASEIKQVLEHIEGLANTKVNNKFLFNGTNTTNKPVDLTKFDLPVSELVADPSKHNIMFTKVNGEEVHFSYDSTNGTDLVYKNGTETITVTDANQVKYNNGTTGFSDITLNSEQYVINHNNGVAINNNTVQVEVMKGIKLGVNVNPSRVFSTGLFKDVTDLINELKTANNGESIDDYLTKLDNRIEGIVRERSELGARFNRAEMIEERVDEHEVIAKKIMSDNEDIDTERVIINLTQQETVHRAALAAGARIIQPSLMDFLR
ncbi:flagellar hook-associated protein FlgL [Bacillus sp. AK128]